MRALFLCFTLGLSSALAAPAVAVEPGAPVALLSEEQMIGAAARDLVRGRDGLEDGIKGGLVQAYLERGDRPMWVDREGLTPFARNVIGQMMMGHLWGLDRKALGLFALQQRVLSAQVRIDGRAMTEAAADARGELAALEADIAIHVARYAKHARAGRVDPRTISYSWDQDPKQLDYPGLLAGVLDAPSAQAGLEALHPSHTQFRELRARYVKALQAVNAPKSEITLPAGPTLRSGMRHPHVALLRERLDIDAGDTATLFDDDVEEAVRAFQSARGITVDGLVGPGTRRALNGANPGNRLKRLLVNMERWRWMPDDLGARYIWSNVPEFHFRVMDGDRVAHQERIVVGKPRNKTPIFSDELERIEFNPYWNVPNSIKVEEILPGLRRGGSNMAKNNLRIKDRSGRVIDHRAVDWSSTDIRNFHVYQPPGGPNVLGDMKFMFPNKHSVYMHDTTSKSLFARSVRTFSHGCMRVRNPRAFARVILAKDQGWTRERIDAVIATGQHTPVYLKKKVPVHITYFTARVDEKGRLQFYGDPYGHDSRTSMALDGKPLPPSVKQGPSLAPITDPRPQRVAGNDVFSGWARQIFGITR